MSDHISNSDETTTDGENSDESVHAGDGRLTTTRRRVLGAAAAGGAVTGIAGLGLAQQGGQQTTIQLVGRVEGWRYEGDLNAPYIGSGERINPTLTLQSGTQYEVIWENADGVPHNFAIRNEAGDNLVQTEIINEQGATQSVTFTASAEMTTYLCEVHPTTMRGQVEVSGGTGTTTPTPTETETETETETPEQGARFFERGTEVGVKTVAEGMTAPTDFAMASGENDRWFVADQTGQVWVVTDGGRMEEPFIDVSDRMVTLGEFNGSYADPDQAYDERGLLGIDFHPDFANNRKFYLHYSAPPNENTPDGWDHVEVLSEFTATQDGSRGQPDSECKLLEIQHPQYNHDAGPFGFGPDGYLYFPMGDGGGADDDMYGHVDDWYGRNDGGNGQDITDNLLGDILRIDVDDSSGGEPYGIPDDNPYVDTEALPEIYASGLRNPFGMSFDSEGNLFLANAGQNLWEMAYVVEKGDNMGWNVLEGTHCFSTEQPSETGAITRCPYSEPDEPPYDGSAFNLPIVEYPHTYQGESVGIVIVGGHRYENSAISGLEGKYVFGDWSADPARTQPAGRVFAATPPDGFGGSGQQGAGSSTDGQMGSTTTEPEGVPRDELWDMEELVFAGSEDGSLGYFVRMFGQDPQGNVYVLANQRGVPEGSTGVVMQLVPPEEGENLGARGDQPAGDQTGGGATNFDATVNVLSDDQYGDILVDSDGLSLYLFVPDGTGKSTCYGECAGAWPPLIVEDDPTKGDAVTATLGTTTRRDGSRQVTAASHPLYLFVRDEQPGDTAGQGITGFGGEWYLLAPDGSRIENGG